MPVKTLFFGLIFLALVACKNEPANKLKILSMDEIIKSSESTKLTQDTIIEVASIDSVFLQNVSILKVVSEDVKILDTLLFVDRYENISSYKYQVVVNNKPSFFAQWRYKNAAKAKNAFINWTQCYGANCTALKLNDTIAISAEKIAMLLVGEKLYYLKDISKKEYTSFVKKTLENSPKQTVDYAFYQDGKKGIQWYRWEDFDKIK